ncbi:MDR family MFS transporter [Pigmentiphaga sp.]|uniref:MDR family MFS transporter n=2 Tax=Pigmentiphaga TaxID=152267 RepID=UPI0025DC0857|nr:MDR family MFS transporter [Pigmentiphaga sp.]MBX6317897.1 MFS transporter [Pigmentiphaga sp.]
MQSFGLPVRSIPSSASVAASSVYQDTLAKVTTRSPLGTRTVSAASARSSRPLVIASVMASMFMIAIEATIVATAMPQIAADLGGLKLYSWVFASFLLTQTAMTVVFGKLSDVYGRKPVMLAGIAAFLLGSILAGFAWSMPSMIVFRLIQGIGAGAIQPVGMTIIADLYPMHERGKIQGYLASVWAVSGVMGPMLGALIIHHFSWAWIFWMNVPVALLASAGFIYFLHERRERRQLSIDVPGAILFTGAVAALMVALTDAGDGRATRAWIATGAFLVLLVLFIAQERRAADPMVSFSLWGRRPIAAANAAMLLGSMVIMGLTTFLPMYVQGVQHRTPVVAGLALTMIMVGWPVGSTFAAKVFPRYGLRPMMIAGSILVPIGACAFLLLGPDNSPVLAGAGSLVVGLGMGFMGVCSLVLIQEIVGLAERGSATASNIFARNLGSTLGAAALGAVFNFGLSRAMNGTPVSSEQLTAALQSGAGVSPAIEHAMQQSLHGTFWGVLLMSLLVMIATVCIPPTTIGRRRQAEVSGPSNGTH